MSETPGPPPAQRRPHRTRLHGRERVDDYFWLRDRSDPEVDAYLCAENAFTETMTAHTEALRKRLFEEMLGRIKQTDLTVPYRRGTFLYYSRTEEGKQYRIYCRRPVGADDAEAVLLDHNALAEGRAFCRLGALEVSPDHRLLAFAVDYEGDERYELRFKDLDTGESLAECIPDASTSLAWASDNRTIFYTTLDETHRPWRVCRHRLGSDPASDECVRQEDDQAFFLAVSRTRSGRYILLEAESRTTSEVRWLSADEPHKPFEVLAERRAGVEYAVEHQGERFLIRSNDTAVNFRLLEAPVDDPAPGNWRELIPHRRNVKLESVDAFRDHLVLVERRDGLERIRIREVQSGEEHLVEFDEPAWSLWLQGNREYDTTVLRFHYTSLVTPESVYDYDMRTRRRELRKRQEVLGGYDPGRYLTERIHARASDGVEVPITLLRRRDIAPDGRTPLVLYGYGAYGISVDASFGAERLSLVDRGFTYAIAHVRGGGDLGRPWYEDGKLFRKKNTFTDFIACAEHLIGEGYTSPERLVIRGGSAGGLLVGAVANLRPDLFRVAVARVPFVDLVNTMLDPSLPLTVIEWEEWGDPRRPDDFRYMLSYSPYDNVDRRPYPDILVMTGVNDPRVQYWEPAKWVARLRACTTGNGLILLRTDMDAGHAGASGRYDALEELAFEYAFVLDRLGVGE